MKKIPMMLQLSAILFCVMAIPIGILTWYSGGQIIQNSEKAIAESALAGLNANRMLNENALDNVSLNTVRLASTGIFDRIRSMESYDELNENYQRVHNADTVLNELLTLNKSIDGIYSSFFYLDDADYVVSSDKGITKLEKYESLDWLDDALRQQSGVRGLWYSRKNGSGVDVMSFVLPLSQLVTTTRGTIVINLNEKQVEQYLQSTTSGKQEYMLMDRSGLILSHADKTVLRKNGADVDAFVREILESGSSMGHAIYETDDGRLLYTWSRSKNLGWINVSTYSVDELMNNTHILQKNIIVLTLIIILVGSALSVALATWLYKPIRTLVRNVRESVNMGGGTRKNELAFLEEAFRRMQDEEEELHKLLEEREHGVRDYAIRNLLRGEVTAHVEEIFTAEHFLVVVVSIDHYREYISQNNPETRKFHRYALSSQYDKLFPYDTITRCVYQGEGHFVILINHGPELYVNSGKVIEAILGVMKDKAIEILGHSVTVGVSSRSDSIHSVADQFTEAMEAIKKRMVAGGGCILHWSEDMASSKKYIYPANSESRILNFMNSGSLQQIKDELKVIREEIRSADYVSFDNILFIYNQLAGATIKQLRENNVNTNRMFMKQGSIYATLSSCDTLDEIEECFVTFYSKITQYFLDDSKESNPYGEKIVQYLYEHYSQEIDYEDMAKDIGISYSYMRKITYEVTGLSLVDYLNKLRIEKAKELLTQSELTIAQTAAEVGYYNVRSLNHYFRKFEGMTPSNYKALKQK